MPPLRGLVLVYPRFYTDPVPTGLKTASLPHILYPIQERFDFRTLSFSKKYAYFSKINTYGAVGKLHLPFWREQWKREGSRSHCLYFTKITVKFRINRTPCAGSVRKPNLPGNASVSLFFGFTIIKVESIEIHDLVPRCHEVTYKCLLGIITPVDFCDGTELGV